MSSYSIVIACRRSPARLAGATCPIGSVVVTPPKELRLWDQHARTLRFHRDLSIVTFTSAQRWADFAIEYAALIAHAFDGVVAVEDEVLGEVEIDPEPSPLTDRELGLAWRTIDDRAQAALDDYDRAMRIIVGPLVSHRALGLPLSSSRPLD
ncbi:MAG: hypothetical protein H0V17_21045 [Deltaproteobacteria bacterium]|nr:hypothetical protein [Deltaproteobacteria bacterium]